VGLAASAGLLTAGSALAAKGTVPGGLQLLQTGVVIANGAPGAPLTTTTTWNSTAACPAGFQTSAQLQEWTVTGTPTEVSTISPVTGVGLASPNFTGSLLGTPGALLNTGGINATSPGTLEWVIGCFSGASATGSVSYIGDTFISVASGATNFTLSNTGPVVANTTTTLAATPNPVATGATATLTANVTSGSAFPPGTVQFENCPTPTTCTNINAAVAVNTGSVSVPATTTTSFATAGNVNLAAVFTPTDATAFNGSTGTFALAVGSTLAGGTNPVTVNVTVPSTGTLSVTVATGSVTLTAAAPATTPDETATGTLNTVTVSDTRNTFPGWSVAGQESVFTGPGTPAATIPANSLGWTPAFVGATAGSPVIGATVAPSGANAGSTGPGLGTAATLALAHAGNGFGTNNINAALLLDIPSTTPPGAYSGTMTITFVSAQA
jgi:hypothetical protein